MTTNATKNALIKFNRRILKELSLDGESFNVYGVEGTFLRNPIQTHKVPIVLLPKDILRKLPIALDWDEVAETAAYNDALRDRVNKYIGHIWAAKTKRDKDELRSQALASKAAFEALLDVLHEVPPSAYNVNADPDGLIIWAHIGRQFATSHPLDLSFMQHPANIQDVYQVVLRIVERFKQLIEHNGLNKELYKENGDPRHESTVQRLFFTVAYCYCEANNVDINPEVDSGTGQVDFKFSMGFDTRVLIEIKLSTNSSLIHGYKTQLEIYKASEQTMRAIYLVVDVGNMEKKHQNLLNVRNEASERHEPLSEIVVIDGKLKASASKR